MEPKRKTQVTIIPVLYTDKTVLRRVNINT